MLVRKAVLLRGRGAAGAMPEEARFAQIRSLVSGDTRWAEVAPDRGFVFGVAAFAGEVLEIRAALGEDAQDAGAPIYIRVPRGILPPEPYFCCQETQACQPISLREQPCPAVAPGGFLCAQDADCGLFENELLPLAATDINVSRVSDQPTVVLEGQVVPSTLVKVVNRGKTAVGGVNPRQAWATVSDDAGRFSLSLTPVASDDELVVQLEDLNGYTSPDYAFLVPDSPLASVDVLEIFPWAPLTPGDTGTLAVRVRLSGQDGFGICPNESFPEDGLELCMSGGLAHAMLSVSSATIEESEDVRWSLAPRPAPVSADNPYNRGVEGNVRAPEADVVLVVDRTARGATIDPNGEGLVAMGAYLNNLPQSARVGLVSFGSQVEVHARLVDAEQRPELRSTLAALTQNRGGFGDLAAAIVEAVEMFGALEGTPRERKVIILTGSAPEGTAANARRQFDPLLEVIRANPSAGFLGVQIDVLAVDVNAQLDTYPALRDLSVFSGGLWREQPTIEGVDFALTRMRGSQFGGFLLLYEVDIRADVSRNVRVLWQVSTDSETLEFASTTYEGPLEIANAQVNVR